MSVLSTGWKPTGEGFWTRAGKFALTHLASIILWMLACLALISVCLSGGCAPKSAVSKDTLQSLRLSVCTPLQAGLAVLATSGTLVDSAKTAQYRQALGITTKVCTSDVLVADDLGQMAETALPLVATLVQGLPLPEEKIEPIIAGLAVARAVLPVIEADIRSRSASAAK